MRDVGCADGAIPPVIEPRALPLTLAKRSGRAHHTSHVRRAIWQSK